MHGSSARITRCLVPQRRLRRWRPIRRRWCHGPRRRRGAPSRCRRSSWCSTPTRRGGSRRRGGVWVWRTPDLSNGHSARGRVTGCASGSAASVRCLADAATQILRLVQVPATSGKVHVSDKWPTKYTPNFESITKLCDTHGRRLKQVVGLRCHAHRL